VLLNKTCLILDYLKACLYSTFLWLKCSFGSDRFFSLRRLRMHFDVICPPHYKHLHLSTSFVRTSFNSYTFSELLLPRNYCLSELAFNRIWNWLSQLLKPQIWTQIWAISVVFGEGSDSDYFGWYFWLFRQYPKDATDIWNQVHYLLLPQSLK
jgi:hypothetical protein